MYDIVDEMLEDRPDMPPARIAYGVATAVNTVPIDGSSTAVPLPAVQDVATGQRAAILIQGSDKLILGPVDSGWQAMTLTSDWEQWSSTWYAPAFRVINGEVQTSGLLRRLNTTMTADSTIATLPSVAVPERISITSAMTSDSSLPVREIRLSSSGVLQIMWDNVNLSVGQYVSLDGCRFRATF